MRRTPWTSQNSSLPSDRLKPTVKPASNNVAKTKGKGRQQPPPEQPPKSKNIRRLEALLIGIQNSTGQERDPKGGCFCLARTHDLSLYTPICPSCGLILCSVNLPQYCCPYCDKVLVLVGGTVRESVINKLEHQVASTIAREEAEKERAIEAAQRAAGAFPTLSGAASASPSPSLGPPGHSAAQPGQTTHKVLSLTSNSRRVVVSSYTNTPVHSRPVSRNDSEIEDEPIRVPRPPPEPMYAGKHPSPDRPWENLIHGGVTYKPPARLDDDGSSKGSSRKKRGNKGKEKQNASEQKG